MAYFNHAFCKLFLGTKPTQASVPGTAAGVDNGFLVEAGVPSVGLSDVGAPYSLRDPQAGESTFGLFNPNTFVSVVAADPEVTGGKPLILASSSLYQNDKVGPFHGGYAESTKSKMINPKYVSRFYRVDPCDANASVIHIGNTGYSHTANGIDPGENYPCDFEFLCDEQYQLRIDVKGSPALRYLSRNGYFNVSHWTGCCADPTAAPVPVDSTEVMIAWAKDALDNPTIAPFLQFQIYREDTGAALGGPNDIAAWDAYVSPGHTASNTAGMTITGAFVDTQFGDCTFYPTDHFEKEPVKVSAALVDETGDPCLFETICVQTQCFPRQGQGFGEQVLRDLILSESYMQNYFGTGQDLRIREITQGYDISSAIVRSAKYYRYYLQHSVPRFNNPSGTFDDDQYMLEIITPTVSGVFESTVSTWLDACGCNAEFEAITCGASCP